MTILVVPRGLKYFKAILAGTRRSPPGFRSQVTPLPPGRFGHHAFRVTLTRRFHDQTITVYGLYVLTRSTIVEVMSTDARLARLENLTADVVALKQICC